MMPTTLRAIAAVPISEALVLVLLQRQLLQKKIHRKREREWLRKKKRKRERSECTSFEAETYIIVEI